MDLSLMNEEDIKLLAAVRAEVLDKAKGTFLWVVLIVRELLNAIIAGATLGELSNIVQDVPPDLSELYQQLLQKTTCKDRDYMLRLLQLVFYAQDSLTPTVVRYALAFGSRAYASYTEWSQSSEYVRSDEQMEKRIRAYSKGLVEIVPSPARTLTVVQFIHQSVSDFLGADGFSFLRDRRWRTHSADGHEFLKTACLNYLRIKDLEDISVVDLRVNEQLNFPCPSPSSDSAIEYDSFLEYAVRHIFPHAAQAEQNGLPQDSFRTDMYDNIQGCFERWRCFHDMFSRLNNDGDRHGPDARPIHVLAHHNLLTRDIAEKEMNIDIASNKHGSALIVACDHRHQDAVKILLDLGADPRYKQLGFRTPFEHAALYESLPLLRQLVNGLRLPLTLQERLEVAGSVRFERPQSEAFLALLLPEAIFPDSAIDYVCEAAGRSVFRVFSFLLDKSEDSIVHEKRLWHAVLRDEDETKKEKFSQEASKIRTKSTHCLRKIRTMLDRGGTVVITEAIVEILADDIVTASKVLSLLLEKCKAEITEDFVDSICCFEDSSQIVRIFEAAGYPFDPFTSRQLGSALLHGSAETAAFFLQRQHDNMSADEMLNAASYNRSNGGEVTHLVLSYLNPHNIKEQTVLAALANETCSGEILKLFRNRLSSLTFSEAALAVAVRYQDIDLVRYVLERCECARVTEKIMNAAAGDKERCAAKFNLLLIHDPDIRVQESTIIEVFRNLEDISHDLFPENVPVRVLDVFRRHGKPLLCTETVVVAAAESMGGPECLKIIIQQDPEAKFSSTIITMAMKAERGAALISVMLQHDNTISINDEHLIAAASNPYDPSTLFAFLQTKGKLDNTEPASEAVSSNRAKRRRVSHKSPPRISTEVIDVAFSNPGEAARDRLLKLFLEWDIITTADYNDRSRVAPFGPIPDYLPY